MDLEVKKIELIELLRNYLEGNSSLQDLQVFAGDILSFFSLKKNTEHLAPKIFEKEFWFAIWQIQHFADTAHEKEGVTARELSEALEYLIGNKQIPKSFIGKRP